MSTDSPDGSPAVEAATEPQASPEPVFTYKPAGGAIVIFWRGRQVKTVGGAVGALLLRKLGEADAGTQQELLDRAAGNFKRGTERSR